MGYAGNRTVDVTDIMIQRKETPEDILSFIESYYEDGHYEKATRELKRARLIYPENLTFLEWEAVFAGDENRFRDALECLETVLEAKPERPFALREKAAIFRELGRFGDALEIFIKIGPENDKDSIYYFDLGYCHDRLGQHELADRNYSKAAEMDSRAFKLPERSSNEEFHALIKKVTQSQCPELEKILDKVEVVIQDFPDSMEFNPFALGKVVQGPRSRKTGNDAKTRKKLVLFKRNFELEFQDEESLEVGIQKTLMSELGMPFEAGGEG